MSPFNVRRIEVEEQDIKFTLMKNGTIENQLHFKTY